MIAGVEIADYRAPQHVHRRCATTSVRLDPAPVAIHASRPMQCAQKLATSRRGSGVHHRCRCRRCRARWRRMCHRARYGKATIPRRRRETSWSEPVRVDPPRSGSPRGRSAPTRCPAETCSNPLKSGFLQPVSNFSVSRRLERPGSSQLSQVSESGFLRGGTRLRRV